MSDIMQAFRNFQEAIRVDETPLPIDPNAPLEEGHPKALDLFSLMGEWTALRQELKSQNKVQHNTQLVLQKALDGMDKHQEKMDVDAQKKNEELEQTRAEMSHSYEEQGMEQLLGLLKSLLPALDSLDYAIDHWETSQTSYNVQPAPWFGKGPHEQLGKTLKGGIDGLIKVRQKFWDSLNSQGFEPQDPTGTPFDPAEMMAVGTHPVTAPDKANLVQKVQLRGYHWQGRVLRPSEVIVSKLNA